VKGAARAGFLYAGPAAFPSREKDDGIVDKLTTNEIKLRKTQKILDYIK